MLASAPVRDFVADRPSFSSRVSGDCVGPRPSAEARHPVTLPRRFYRYTVSPATYFGGTYGTRRYESYLPPVWMTW